VALGVEGHVERVGGGARRRRGGTSQIKPTPKSNFGHRINYLLFSKEEKNTVNEGKLKRLRKRYKVTLSGLSISWLYKIPEDFNQRGRPHRRKEGHIVHPLAPKHPHPFNRLPFLGLVYFLIVLKKTGGKYI